MALGGGVVGDEVEQLSEELDRTSPLLDHAPNPPQQQMDVSTAGNAVADIMGSDALDGFPDQAGWEQDV